MQSKNKNNNQKNKKNFQRFALIAMGSIAAFAITPEIAMADAPQFAGGVNTFKNDIITILTPVFGFGIIGCGVAAWMGKISWNWCLGLIFGAILVFGNEQIVNWIRGAFSV